MDISVKTYKWVEDRGAGLSKIPVTRSDYRLSKTGESDKIEAAKVQGIPRFNSYLLLREHFEEELRLYGVHTECYQLMRRLIEDVFRNSDVLMVRLAVHNHFRKKRLFEGRDSPYSDTIPTIDVSLDIGSKTDKDRREEKRIKSLLEAFIQQL